MSVWADILSQRRPEGVASARADRMTTALVLCAASVLLAGAAPGGGLFAGTWRTPQGEESVVKISYRPEKKGEGRISMQLGPEGERFAGEYLRLKPETPNKRLEQFHAVWSSRDFDDYRHGPSGAPWQRTEFTLETFRKRYSGRVVATLAGQRGASMRCFFELEDPARGMPGGASGQCQASSGDVVTLGKRKSP